MRFSCWREPFYVWRNCLPGPRHPVAVHPPTQQNGDPHHEYNTTQQLDYTRVSQRAGYVSSTLGHHYGWHWTVTSLWAHLPTPPRPSDIHSIYNRLVNRWRESFSSDESWILSLNMYMRSLCYSQFKFRRPVEGRQLCKIIVQNCEYRHRWLQSMTKDSQIFQDYVTVQEYEWACN